MSPLLVKQLYQQIKQVIARSIAIIDRDGKPYSGANDFLPTKEFLIRDNVSAEKRSVAIAGKARLRALPLFQQNKLLGLIVIETTEEDSQTIQVLHSLAELIIQQFVNTHKPRPDAVDLLMTRLAYRPDSIDAEELEQQMAALGFRLDLQRTSLVLKLSGFWDNYLQSVGQPLGEKQNLIAAKKHDIERSLASFFSKNQDNVIGYIGNDSFLVLKDLSTTDYHRFCELVARHFSEIIGGLKNVHIADVKVSIGSAANSIDQLISSTREAVEILEIGERVDPNRKVYRKEDLGIIPILLASSNEIKENFASEALSKLTDQELLLTLKEFLGSNLNLTQTAEALKVHRNTVIYRLDKIEELLAKDPRKFEDAVSLYIALKFKQIFTN
jgi:carbohydrate diacid regulator